MTEEPVTVGLSNRVKTAVLLMKGHHISALPVIGNDAKVVGLVSHQQLLGESDSTPIPNVMDKSFLTCKPETTIKEAADLLGAADTNHVLVMEDDNLVGIISESDLVSEIGKSFDPMTGLPWADTFREWTLDALRKNMEISVIFFDLDKFGMYNKKYGHIVGDTVLKEIAKIIEGSVDENSDCACRYGGDEFAIVSIRRAEMAEELAEEIIAKISKLKITDVPETVGASYGISGGRRTREREDMHYAATIDNLITRASKECSAKKLEKIGEGKGEPAAVQTHPRQDAEQPQIQTEPTYASAYTKPTLHDVSISTTQAEYTASVVISALGQLFQGAATRPATGSRGLPSLVAEAAANAVNKIMSPGFGLGIEEVVVAEVGRFEDIVTVVAVISTPTSGLRFPATTLAQRGDCLRPVANAVLEAIAKQPDTIYSIPQPEQQQSTNTRES